MSQIRERKVLELVAAYCPRWTGEAAKNSYIFKQIDGTLEVRFYNVVQVKNREFEARLIVFDHGIKNDSLYRITTNISDDYQIERKLFEPLNNALSMWFKDDSKGISIAADIADLIRNFSHALHAQADEGSRLIMKGIDDFLADMPEQRTLVEGLINQGELIMLYAPSGYGASTFLMNLMFHMWNAKDFLGFRIPKPLRVGYVQYEGSPWETLDRFKKLVTAFPGFDYKQIPYHREYTHKLSDPDAEATWRNIVKDNTLDILVPDDFASFRGSYDENSANDMKEALNKMGNVAAGTGIGIVFPHHVGKEILDKRTGRIFYPLTPRGSTEIEGKVDGSFRFVPDPERPKELRQLDSHKLRASSKDHVHKVLAFDDNTMLVRETSFIHRRDLVAEQVEESPYIHPKSITELREKLGLTQEELAEKIGARRESIINWEAGKSAPQAKFRTRMATLQKKTEAENGER